MTKKHARALTSTTNRSLDGTQNCRFRPSSSLTPKHGHIRRGEIMRVLPTLVVSFLLIVLNPLQLHDSKSLSTPVHRTTIIHHGTPKEQPKAKPKPKSIVHPSFEYIVTAYTDGYESTQKKPGQIGYGITASGTVATQGRTISCSPNIPFGTVIEIQGVGVRVCEDRGSAIQSNHIDLFIADLHDAREFGRQTLKITILKRGNGHIN